MSRFLFGLGAALTAISVAAALWISMGTPEPDPAAEPGGGRRVTVEQKGRRTLRDRPSNEPADPPERYRAAIAPGTAAPSSAAAPAQGALTTKPNVVLVIGCTVRKDQMSMHGGPANVTPRLTAMANAGVVFDDVIAAAPWTRAASTSIVTGSYAVSLGMVEPGEGRDERRLPDSVVTLAEHMQQRGYFTVGASANPNLSATFGFQQGFDVYQPGEPRDWDNHDGTLVADAVVTAIKANRESGDTRPVYARMMMIDAHSIRTATGELLDPYREDDIPERIAQYRYHLNQLDHAVGYLQDRLAPIGLDASNTVFVFVADHGEGMNYPRHHGYSHGQYLTPSTNHVSWILQGPGVAAGHRVYGVASQIDVVPTLLELVGAPLADPALVEGISLASQVRGSGAPIPRASVWSDTWFQQSNRAAVFTRTRQCQADFGSSEAQRAKGLFVPGCYDRVADPLYVTPVADDALMTELRTWRAERTAHLPSVLAGTVDVDAELSQQLEKLGYRE
jgi:arylsulfatase A-like enzyme